MNRPTLQLVETTTLTTSNLCPKCGSRLAVVDGRRPADRVVCTAAECDFVAPNRPRDWTDREIDAAFRKAA